MLRHVKEDVMGAKEMVASWTEYLKSEVLSGLGTNLGNALASLSVMMADARHCQSGRLAAHGCDEAKPASRRRRWERWLANPRFDPRVVQQKLNQSIWKCWRGAQALLLLDETPKANDLRCLRVSLAYRHRAMPLASICYRPHRLPQPMPKLVRQVLARAVAEVPAGVSIVVIADRGLAWPSIVDWCQKQKCHYLLRLQSTTQMRRGDGSIHAVKELAPRPGCRPWCGTAEVFRKAGWRTASVIAQWPRGCQEPWLLVTDQSACAGRWQQYARRMWIEESFRDEKSQGFQWQSSRINDPRRTERLLLIMTIAQLLLISLGTWLIKRGHRRRYDPRRYRRLSLFQLGLTAWRELLTNTPFHWPTMIYLCPS
jgi:TusA-related sulfurtransferase